VSALQGLSRRQIAATVLVTVCAPALSVAAVSPSPVEVWKDPACGCCKDWVTHLESAGFKVKVSDTGNNAARSRLGIDQKHGSCHTALVGGYAIEGHVPAREIKRLLAERPAAIGLAVPGMPVGSPGMDGAAYGSRKDTFDVLLLAKDGSTKVYQHYEGVTKASGQDVGNVHKH
jgi:hypothetical protein